ncbi:MAG: hypothetical protein J7L73_01205 [Anaerolineales bacterium]|nr:hypothetical protein [Anaerolineales bacterium]
MFHKNKSRSVYIRRMVNLGKEDYWIIKRIAQEKGLGSRGFSAALRLIIREWYASYTAHQK